MEQLPVMVVALFFVLKCLRVLNIKIASGLMYL